VRRFLSFGIAMLGLAGCLESDPDKNPVERLGLAETTNGRALVEDAIAKANAIAGTRHAARLFTSWQNTDSAKDAVTVYLIAPDSIASAYNVMVPTNCRCVFVQPRAFEEWVFRRSGASTSMLEVQRADILAFMLLHELGHIRHGDPGQFEAEHGNAEANFLETSQKQRETSADRFAVDLISAASQDSKAVAGWLSANSLQIALTNLSWNLASMRLIGNFGASTLCAKSAFGDSGYTHPNLELRVLTTNALLANTETARQLLDDFQGCRRMPRQPSVLGDPLQSR